MATDGQKACLVIDHLVEALGNDPSSSLRRALILTDIDHHPGTTQAEIMARMDLHKSALNREIEWLFNYGCIMMQDSAKDARTKTLHVCGYSKKGLDSALEYFKSDHQKLKNFIVLYTKVLRQEKPTLRDAKILAYLYNKKVASKAEVLNNLYDAPTTTDHRAFGEILNAGVIKGVQDAA
ncbi:MAG: MarR family winged helix-turn-helix transcriptional regulator [Alphaproteobacteria bacterium]|nr:MarR family winged helix-turn-helix transcriptional regulator [Alphaproteobacteria bacterium]MCD8570578.1 MarR family winged helix-turn-helix transcriptional regulator [Alphaproteobacteria bacterium]